MLGAVQLSGIFVYPIKACAGVSLASAEVVERGLLHDRRYMLVDRGGQFVSQREAPRLCLVATALEQNGIEVTAKGHPRLCLPRALEPGIFESRPY